MRGIQSGLVVLALCAAGAVLPTMSAEAAVYGTVWVEVDNSEGGINEAEGVPTGLDGWRTFDLYAIVTSDTEILVADFGFVASDSQGARPMWTTQEVYQNEFGDNSQSSLIGALRMPQVAALEYDTYVGLGKIDTTLVRNATILGADWNPEMFRTAWFTSVESGKPVIPAKGDEEDRLFLARITVSSASGFGDYSASGEYLGGAFYIGGSDQHGGIGLSIAQQGVFPTRNAFDGPEPLYFSPVEGIENPNADPASADEEVLPTWSRRDRLDGDMNFDGVTDELDMELLLSVYGTRNPLYDLTGDLLIEQGDVLMLNFLITGEFPEFDEGTPNEQRKAARAYRKLMKQAIKAEENAEKRSARVAKRSYKRLRKELKRQERAARQAANQQ